MEMRYTDMSPNIRKRHGWYSLYSIITTRPIIYLYVWNERQKGSKSHAATTDTKLGLKKEYYTPRICKILGLANHIPDSEGQQVLRGCELEHVNKCYVRSGPRTSP